METRYELYVTDNGDGTMNVTVRDNERLARYMENGDLDYTWTYYNLTDEEHKNKLDKYNDKTIHYLTKKGEK